MKILALDLASTTGYAAILEGVRSSGTVNCTTRLGRPVTGGPGWRYIRFNHWLHSTWREKNLDLVVYEKPIPIHSSYCAAEVAFGLSTRVEEFAARANVQCEAVNVKSVKAFAGNGNADKAWMVKAAQILKPGVTSADEADALWILEYALGNFGKQRRSA